MADPKQIPKVKFWWATVGDAKPEPVVVDHSGDRGPVIYTIGCSDPLPRSAVRLLDTMEIPPTPEEREAAMKRREKAAKKATASKDGHGHMWRRWNP